MADRAQRVPISEEQAQRMMQKQMAQEERTAAQDEQRESLLRAFVSAEGRERLKRIEQVKAERARAVEVHIINAVRGGKLNPPVYDDTVRELLAQMSTQEQEVKQTIHVVRKRNEDDWWSFLTKK